MRDPAGDPAPIAPRAAPRGVALALACSAIAGAACLPGDTRPVPESVYVTVEPSAALSAPIETADGWSIRFDRLVTAVGSLHFENEDASCNRYADARYDRLFDFTVAGRAKVGTLYGLGTCRLEFRLRAPSFDTLLEAGATASDVARMRTRGSDAFATDDRVSVIAKGAAARAGVTKRFEWVFRRSYQLTNCEIEGGFATTLTLREGGASEVRLELRGEELFRARADDAAELVFQPIADADADGDGAITLEELAEAPRPVDPGSGGGGGSGGGAAASLGGLVYNELLPRLLRVAGAGPCEAEARSPR